MEAYKILELYRSIVDAYAIDIFVENHWENLPNSWREMFDQMEPRAWIEILDVNAPLKDTFPLSFLCLRQLFVKFTRQRAVIFSPSKLGELLGFETYDPVFPKITANENVRRRVKEKKQHEIDRLIYLLKTMPRCGANFDFAVDVGSGIGHLSRFLALELPKVPVLSIEVNSQFVETANRIDEKMKTQLNGCLELPDRIQCLLDERSDACIAENSTGKSGLLLGLHPCGDLSATILRAFTNYSSLNAVVLIGCCYHKLNNGVDKLFRQEWEASQSPCNRPGFPLSRKYSSVQLSYAARELACHAVEHFAKNLTEDKLLPRNHFYRAMVELALWEEGQQEEYRHIPVKGVKRAESLQFDEYFEAALDGQEDFLRAVRKQVRSSEKIGRIHSNAEEYIRRTMFFYYLRLLFAPIVEHVLVADRLEYIEECGYKSYLLPLFDPVISPRNFVIFAHK